MSSSIVVIEVPRAENETVFLLRVVQAALKAYRSTPNKSAQVDNPLIPAHRFNTSTPFQPLNHPESVSLSSRTGMVPPTVPEDRHPLPPRRPVPWRPVPAETRHRG